jgi:hypothetical protein
VAQGDDTGLFDLLQGAGELGGENWRADQSGSNGCAQDMGNDAHQIFLDIVFFMEPVCRPFLCFECLTAPEVSAQQAFVERV